MKNCFQLMRLILMAGVIGLLLAAANAETSDMDIAHTLADGCQIHTFSYSGLCFLTGSIGANSFLPPGKMADYFGFQFLRDNDPDDMGHNTTFLDRAANNLLYFLTETQRESLIALGYEQVDQINDYAYARFPLLDAFQRLLDDDMPIGAIGLNLDSVMAYSAYIFSIDAEIAYGRAQVMGTIISELTPAQRESLDALTAVGFFGWPERDEIIPRESMPHDVHVAAMTYASQMFAWYAGNTESDVYFCPERVATYFGGFYVKDIPAMLSDTGYTIPSDFTGNMGRVFLHQIGETDSALVVSLVDTQRADLYAIVDLRDSISQELRGFMAGDPVDSARLADLIYRYGERDGRISYWYATIFAMVRGHMTSWQMDSLYAYRDLEPYSPDSAFCYSDRIAMPAYGDSDFLFDFASTKIDNGAGSLPENVAMVAYPNPFNDAVRIAAPDNVPVEILDCSGRRVFTHPGGEFIWSPGANADSGIYFVRIRGGDSASVQRIIYLR